MKTYAVPIFMPLYRQIKDLLLARISSGEWSPGTFIPSELQLSKTYNVSVGTLRKAIDELVVENIVIRQQGKGTVVATHDGDSALFRFFNLRRKFDGERVLPVSITILRALLPASELEAYDLGLQPGDFVVHIQRVRELDGAPVVLEDIHLDAKKFEGLEKYPEVLPNTLYRLYQEVFGVTVVQAEEVISAVAAGKQEKKYLSVKLNQPLLEIKRLARDINGNVVERRVSLVTTTQHYYMNQL